MRFRGKNITKFHVVSMHVVLYEYVKLIMLSKAHTYAQECNASCNFAQRDTTGQRIIFNEE